MTILIPSIVGCHFSPTHRLDLSLQILQLGLCFQSVGIRLVHIHLLSGQSPVQPIDLAPQSVLKLLVLFHFKPILDFQFNASFEEILKNVPQMFPTRILRKFSLAMSKDDLGLCVFKMLHRNRQLSKIIASHEHNKQEYVKSQNSLRRGKKISF